MVTLVSNYSTFDKLIDIKFVLNSLPKVCIFKANHCLLVTNCPNLLNFLQGVLGDDRLCPIFEVELD